MSKYVPIFILFFNNSCLPTTLLKKRNYVKKSVSKKEKNPVKTINVLNTVAWTGFLGGAIIFTPSLTVLELRVCINLLNSTMKINTPFFCLHVLIRVVHRNVDNNL